MARSPPWTRSRVSGQGAIDLHVGVHPDSNPAASEDALFVVTQDGVLHAVSLVDWTERWHNGGYEPETQIAITGDLVLAGAPGALVARHASDGTEAWSVRLPAVTRIAVASDRAYVSGRGSDAITQVDLERHAVVQQLHTDSAEVLTPAIVSDGVIVGYRDARGGSNGVRSFDADGNLRWQFAEPNGYRIDAVVIDEGAVFVYVGVPGVVDVVDPGDGQAARSAASAG